MSKNPYKILGLNEKSSEAEIKKKYRALSLKYHPDRPEGRSGAAHRGAQGGGVGETPRVASDDPRHGGAPRPGADLRVFPPLL